MRAVLRTVNRVLVGLVGLVLFLLGGSVFAVGLGAPAPSWWIHDDRHDVLLSDAERTRWRDDDWWWPVVIAALAVLVLLALWWLTANLRRRRLTEVLVDTGDGEGALLRGRALADALATEAAAQEGVQRARVHLRGRRTAPETRVRLRLEPHVDPGAALDTFTEGALAHARNSAGLASLPAEVRLRGVKHGAERVS
ncbi:alkaline shock response membrane anchor protein AmaP [Streptomyces nigra]|uniref:Alkaline shock response membrane anchor protein AmaP n=1 Tax=Streptomyces nigra TaxID=1827580 RepID=A0ABZ1IQT7_9ACTN|nr:MULTISPECIES: alkaline shock response membrane anchor protein AmaP [Streptomyces]AWE49553.1 alkaline shock response membrane anchor protein AmaP [Streptomyces nigra]MBQ1000855.1 alkaline shock response membrane anchor protein AmaP [Streptomyces sp. RK62]RDS64761.1 alkaline shock response membrane anchor protein AmaP [Streptomyces sp. M7]